VRVEEWYYLGLLHREDGPAIVRYNEHGEVVATYWFIDGREVPRKEESNADR
jgi:hypothetical protein